jgi:hypothetical protein
VGLGVSMLEVKLIARLNSAIRGQIDNLVDQNRELLNNHALRIAGAELKERRQAFDLDDDKKFNLFKDLTNGRKLDERFYSKILAKILDPKTPEIGDIKYLNLFVDFICKKNKNLEKHSFGNNVEVKTENENIDIIISDNKYAIIIENKIANAADQKDQLGRYYETVKNSKKTPMAIVYIPLNPLKYPPFKEYTEHYKKMIPDIKNIFVHLPAINTNANDRNDLVKGFLDECVKLADADEKDKTASVYIDQFLKLIQTKGGLEAMSDLANKQIIEAIYNDYNLVEIANEIGELWNGKNPEKDRLLGEILKDKLKKELKIKEHPKDASVIGKKVGDIFICIWTNDRAIGFVNPDDKVIPKDLRPKLDSFLDEKEFADYFNNEDGSNSKEIYKYFDYEGYKKSLSEVVVFLAEKFAYLENKVKALKLS